MRLNRTYNSHVLLMDHRFDKYIFMENHALSNAHDSCVNPEDNHSAKYTLHVIKNQTNWRRAFQILIS